MQDVIYPTAYIEELCGATQVSEACFLLTQALKITSKAHFVAIFLLNIEGSNLIFMEKNNSNSQAIGIKLENLDDPLCYCVQSGKPVCYNLNMGILPKSIRCLNLSAQSQKECRFVKMFPLLAPGKKVIGVSACFFEEKINESMSISIASLCLYGSAIIARAQEQSHIKQLIQDYESELSRISLGKNSENFQLEEIIGISDSIHTVKTTTIKVAKTDTPILITGETGTGKSLIAKVIHKNSNRYNGPFIEVNCGAIPENLIESELFGYKKGAFSGANYDYPGLFRSAEGGTIFLDEIGELPLHLQSVLLHILQEHKVRPVGSTEMIPLNIRVITATNKNLKKAMEKNLFRKDLYHRIAMVTIDIPPLASRKEDIIPLAQVFFKNFSKKYQCTNLRMTRPFIERLLSYNYEGNIRELAYIIERAVLLSDNNILSIPLAGDYKGNPPHILQLNTYINTKEKELIESYFSLCENDLNLCAELLGVNYRTLLRKAKKYGLHK